jgi:hypothetical protein
LTRTRCVGQRPFPSLAHSAHNCRAPTGQRRPLSPPRSVYGCPQQHVSRSVTAASSSLRLAPRPSRRRTAR